MATKYSYAAPKLGPLTPLVGEWEGDQGIDLSYHNIEDEVLKTTYFEKMWFTPIPTQTNGLQNLEGLHYRSTAWPHGEEAMNPFHDEIGFLLWDAVHEQVLRAVVFGRGISMLAGADAKSDSKLIEFTARPGLPDYGILQNKYLLERAELKSFDSKFIFNDDGTFTHTSDIVLKLAAMGGKEMHHTDENTMKLVKRYHPGSEFA